MLEKKYIANSIAKDLCIYRFDDNWSTDASIDSNFFRAENQILILCVLKIIWQKMDLMILRLLSSEFRRYVDWCLPALLRNFLLPSSG